MFGKKPQVLRQRRRRRVLAVDGARRAQRFGPGETLCPCSLIAANREPNTINVPERCADVSA
jgi:hypothetical protein